MLCRLLPLLPKSGLQLLLLFRRTLRSYLLTGLHSP